MNIIIITHIAQLPGIARRKKIEKEGRTQAGLYLVEKVPAVTIIEINAEPASLTSEKISDYLIQGNTGEVLPQIVEKVRIA